MVVGCRLIGIEVIIINTVKFDNYFSILVMFVDSKNVTRVQKNALTRRFLVYEVWLCTEWPNNFVCSNFVSITREVGG